MFGVIRNNGDGARGWPTGEFEGGRRGLRADPGPTAVGSTGRTATSRRISWTWWQMARGCHVAACSGEGQE